MQASSEAGTVSLQSQTGRQRFPVRGLRPHLSVGSNTSDTSHNVEPDGITTVINRTHRESPVDLGGGAHLFLRYSVN